MSLAARLAETPKQTFPEWLAGLNKADRDALLAVATDTAWTTNRLTRVIGDEGYKVSPNTVMLWRRGLGYPR